MSNLFTLSETDFEKMSYDRYYNSSPMIRKRLLVLVAKHLTQRFNKDLTNEYSVNPNFVSYWTNTYLKDGINAIYTNNYGTNKSKLEEHSALLISYFDKKPAKCINQAKMKIKELTGIDICPTQIIA